MNRLVTEKNANLKEGFTVTDMFYEEIKLPAVENTARSINPARCKVRGAS